MKFSFPRLASVLITSCCIFLLSGCASVVGWNAYDVVIRSSPAATDFVIRNNAGVAVAEGATPAIVTLETSSGFFKPAVYTISAYGEDAVPAQHILRASINPAYYGNFLSSVFGLFGLFGLSGALLIDPMTGAIYKLPASADISQPPDAAAGTPDIARSKTDELDVIDQWDKTSPLDTIEKVDTAIQKSIHGFSHSPIEHLPASGNGTRL